jgi:hypothetical protein
LSGDIAVEVLWQRGADLTVMVTTSSRAREVQEVATRIREIVRRVRERPGSPAAARTSADLEAAMELLLQMTVAEARAKVDAITQP